MSLHEYKMPSLRDKLASVAKEEVKVEEVVVDKVEVVKKGRRLNK